MVQGRGPPHDISLTAGTHFEQEELSLNHLKRWLVVLGLVGTLVAAAVPSFAAHKVTICHRTGSSTNPYVVITISRNALSAHIGPDAHPPKDGREDFIKEPGKPCEVGPK